MENVNTTPAIHLKTNRGWFKFILLTIITFGIYSFWLSIKMKQWVTKHTHMIPVQL